LGLVCHQEDNLPTRHYQRVSSSCKQNRHQEEEYNPDEEDLPPQFVHKSAPKCHWHRHNHLLKIIKRSLDHLPVLYQVVDILRLKCKIKLDADLVQCTSKFCQENRSWQGVDLHRSN